MPGQAQIFGERGSLSGLVQGYGVRPQQQEMAAAIEEAIAAGESLVCEAGTGMGKTFAYLAPALLCGRKTIISTGTRHLQDQLFGKDLPLVRRAVDRPVQAVRLKGVNNYLCRHRLEQAERNPARTVAELRQIRAWSARTAEGDLAELSGVPEEAPARTAVSLSDMNNCLGAACDFYDNCFVFRARRRAQTADLVVVNHHLFLLDLALRKTGGMSLLPQAELVVFDEAHQLPALASRFFGRALDSRQLATLLKDSRKAHQEEAGDLPEFPDLLAAVQQALLDLRRAFPADDQRRAWPELRTTPEVAAALDSLAERLQTLYPVLEALSERGKLLSNCGARLFAALELLEKFHEETEPGYVQWLEIRDNEFFLHHTPLDVAAAFQSHISEHDGVLVFTSATLSVQRRFDYFAAQLGLGAVKTRLWDSPFDFERQSLLYLPRGLPHPSAAAAAFTEAVVEQALPLLRLTGGRAFFLFTSYRALNQATGLLREALDFPILAQGEASRMELLERFKEVQPAVLAGTRSFWEGVDVRGQALSCVIIDKLPFAAPGDPVQEARAAQLQEQGRNPFLECQVPEAAIVLKQGIGRLLRDRNDYGVLMICDPRLSTKGYGRAFLDSLPPMPRTERLADAAAFFQQREEQSRHAAGP